MGGSLYTVEILKRARHSVLLVSVSAVVLFSESLSLPILAVLHWSLSTVGRTPYLCGPVRRGLTFRTIGCKAQKGWIHQLYSRGMEEF